MKDLAVIAAAVAGLLGLGAAVTASQDRTRATSTLEDAYYIRDAGASVLVSRYIEAFGVAGASGVAEEAGMASSQHAVSVLRKAETQAQKRRPVLFGKEVSRVALREARAWTDLVAKPQGAWLTYQTDLAAVRRTLDSAIADAEDYVGREKATQAKTRAAQRVAILEGEVAVMIDKDTAAKAKAMAEEPGRLLDATFDTYKDRAAREAAENERRLEEARKAYEAGQK